MTTRITLAMPLLFILLAGSPASAQAPDTASIKAGLHAPDMPTAVLMTGDAEYLGVSGPFTFFLTSDGRHHLVFGGPLAQKYGFDGTTAWDRDWNQTPRPLHLKEYDEAVLEGLLLSGAWADGADAEGQFHLGTAEPDSVGNPVLEFTFGDRGMNGVITLDQQSQEMISFSYGTTKMRVTTMSAFRDFDGMRWPTRIAQHSPDDSVVLLRINTIEAISEAREVAEMLEPDLARPNDNHFNNDLPAAVELRKAPTGHLLVHPLVDGQDVGWFIFDTGAGASVLDNETAVALGYTSFGEVTAKGVGGDVTSTFYRGQSLQLGRLTMDDPAYIGLDLGFLGGVMGVKIAGVLGYGLISRSIVEFDNAGPEIRVLDPATYKLETGHWTDLVLFGRHPCVSGKFEEHEGVFRLDTGASGTVSFHYPTTERLALLKNRRLTDTHLGGVGGSVKAKAGLMQTLELGGEEFTHLDVEFATEPKGAFNDAYTDGNVGNGLLEPFKLVFDYQSLRMAFIRK